MTSKLLPHMRMTRVGDYVRWEFPDGTSGLLPLDELKRVVRILRDIDPVLAAKLATLFDDDDDVGESVDERWIREAHEDLSKQERARRARLNDDYDDAA